MFEGQDCPAAATKGQMEYKANWSGLQKKERGKKGMEGSFNTFIKTPILNVQQYIYN